MSIETHHFTHALPHESAKAAEQNYSGLSYKQANVGNIGGGTIFAVWQETLTTNTHGSDILASIYNNPVEITTTLDTPDPIENFKPKKAFPFNTLDYQLPRYPDGSPMQWWDMREAYRQNDTWLEQHIAQRSRPGKHIVFAHHNVGIGVEMDLKNELSQQDNANRLVAMRLHSQALVTTLEQTPEYFVQNYGSFDPNSPYFKESTQYLYQLQKDAFLTGDAIFIATEPERQATIDAVVKHNILTTEEAEQKFVTVPIPIDISKFQPDVDGSKRAHQINMFNRMSPEDMQLDSSKRYIGSVSRRDHEKNIWDLVKAYGMFCLNNRYVMDTMPDLLIAGGPTNKPGVAEKEVDMWKFIRSCPQEIQDKMKVLSTPLPHEDIVHILDMEIYPSWEESYNISEKQARSAGKLVALSTTAAGHRGTNTDDSCIWIEPAPLDDSLDNWVTYMPAFENALHISLYDKLQNKQSHIISPSTQLAAEIRKNGSNHVHENFSSKSVLQNTLLQLKRIYPQFFS